MTDAALLLLLAEDWARLTARHRPAARPVPQLHAALTRLAEQAPATAVSCPALLRLLGASVRHRVSVQAAALYASEAAPSLVPEQCWLSVAAAAAQLGLKPDSVRWLLRHRQLAGRRTERGWSVSAAAVRERLNCAA